MFYLGENGYVVDMFKKNIYIVREFLLWDFKLVGIMEVRKGRYFF